jgi:hypothetical protein
MTRYPALLSFRMMPFDGRSGFDDAPTMAMIDAFVK